MVHYVESIYVENVREKGMSIAAVTLWCVYCGLGNAWLEEPYV